MLVVIDIRLDPWIVRGMDFGAMSDRAVLAEIGRRIQAERLNQNVAQADLAERAGISRRALQHLEGGRGCTLSLLLRALRALGRLDAVDLMLPEAGPSPLQLAKLRGRVRQRAGRRPRRGSTPGG
jgi:transcriptional regulator with XRE-family HTH domain